MFIIRKETFSFFLFSNKKTVLQFQESNTGHLVFVSYYNIAARKSKIS